jgi:hypothetical protein
MICNPQARKYPEKSKNQKVAEDRFTQLRERMPHERGLSFGLKINFTVDLQKKSRDTKRSLRKKRFIK